MEGQVPLERDDWTPFPSPTPKTAGTLALAGAGVAQRMCGSNGTTTTFALPQGQGPWSREPEAPGSRSAVLLRMAWQRSRNRLLNSRIPAAERARWLDELEPDGNQLAFLDPRAPAEA